MRLLLDTHAVVWAVRSPKLVGSQARLLLDRPGTLIFVSVISIYEMALKVRLGRWPEAGPVLEDFDQIMDEAGYTVLPLTQQHALLAAQFGSEHRDPFDRMIAASAMTEACLLISVDKALDTFGVRRIW